jgi:hypothetical protein
MRPHALICASARISLCTSSYSCALPHTHTHTLSLLLFLSRSLSRRSAAAILTTLRRRMHGTAMSGGDEPPSPSDSPRLRRGASMRFGSMQSPSCTNSLSHTHTHTHTHVGILLPIMVRESSVCLSVRLYVRVYKPMGWRACGATV